MVTSTSLFTSDRERRLWFCSLAVLVAIYSTLGLAGTLAEVLRENNLMRASFFFLMFLTMATIVGSGLKRRPGRREVKVPSVSDVQRTDIDELPGTLPLPPHAKEERAIGGVHALT